MEIEALTAYRWELKGGADPDEVQALAAELNNLSLPLARSLVLRGIKTLDEARKYFRPDLGQLHDPFLMQDMDLAAERLSEAVLNNERVLVYGDYDVDGVTSTVMMTSFLRSVGVETEFFIPNRTIHGYGLSKAGFDFAAEKECTLVVALDCGITAIEPAKYARSLGLDLIICDHHKATDQIPAAVAVLDPKRPDCNYPFPHLSGCGVGFKLAQATISLLGEDPDKANALMDLVAISIAADIVPMNGENRVLMREGMDLLRKGLRTGTQALASQARLSLANCNTSQIVFGIAPRINAAGRLEDAADAANLLLEMDAERADRLAAVIEKTNERRKKIDRDTEVEALNMASSLSDERSRDAFVLFGEEWHPGVIGITASRVVERFFRPTVMLTTVDGSVKGSARSIHGVNVYDALYECRDLLIQFGGHDFAAGMQLERSMVDLFRQRFEEAVARQLTPELRQPAIRIDAELKLNEIDDRFWAVLRQFDPFGPANSRPVFQTSGLTVVGKPRLLGKSGDHLKFSVRADARDGKPGRATEVIAFGMRGYLPLVEQSQRTGTRLQLAYTVDENEYKGRTTIQLRPKDIRLDSSSNEDAGETAKVSRTTAPIPEPSG